MIYIDGNHRYGACLADSRNCWPLLRVGGLMIWDDYLNGKLVKVKSAVAAFLKSVHWKYYVLFENKQCGIVKTRA